ncbi:MAG: hypothetical protein IID45_05545 [Planctomycetes bacterium]|nr:hypothetical protein [Planctomycetota bacterium]
MPTAEHRCQRRAGASTLDYVLVLGVILPLVFVVVPTGMRIIAGVFDMIAVTVSWPFL